MTTTITPPAASPVFVSFDDAAHALLRQDVSWQSVATKIETCLTTFWPDESKPLLPTIRHILDSEVAVREFLKTMQTATGSSSEVLPTVCRMLIHAAACQADLRHRCRQP